MNHQKTVIEKLGEKNGTIMIKFSTTSIPISVSKRYFNQLKKNDLYRIVSSSSQADANELAA